MLRGRVWGGGGGWWRAPSCRSPCASLVVAWWGALGEWMVWDERVMRGVRTGVYLSLPFRTYLSLISLSSDRPPPSASVFFLSCLGARCPRWLPMRGLGPLLPEPVGGHRGKGGGFSLLGSGGGASPPPQLPCAPPPAPARDFFRRFLPPHSHFFLGCAFFLLSGLSSRTLLCCDANTRLNHAFKFTADSPPRNLGTRSYGHRLPGKTDNNRI